MTQILFATSNSHKIEEANEIGKEFNVNFEQIMVDYPEIRDESVEKVAADGVKFVFDKINKSVIVEDSGLFIDALNNFPGSYSAFVQRKIGNRGILKLLAGEKNRSAKFMSAIGFCDEKGIVKTFTGEVCGRISNEIRGSGGFGYDPVFIPENSELTFAENPGLKNKISHRRVAFEKLCKWLLEEQ